MFSVTAVAHRYTIDIKANTEWTAILCFTWIWNSDFASLTGEVRWAFAIVDSFIHSFACRSVHAWIVETGRLFFTFRSGVTSWTLADEGIQTFIAAGTTILAGIRCITTTLFAFHQFGNHLSECAWVSTTGTSVEWWSQRLNTCSNSANARLVLTEWSFQRFCTILTGPTATTLTQMGVVHNSTSTVVFTHRGFCLRFEAGTQWTCTVLSRITACTVITLTVER